MREPETTINELKPKVQAAMALLDQFDDKKQQLVRRIFHCEEEGKETEDWVLISWYMEKEQLTHSILELKRQIRELKFDY